MTEDENRLTSGLEETVDHPDGTDHAFEESHMVEAVEGQKAYEGG